MRFCRAGGDRVEARFLNRGQTHHVEQLRQFNGVRGVMRQREMPEPRLFMHGEFGGGVAELVTRKLAPVGRHAHAPVLDVHVSLSRREGPAPENAVAAEVALDVNGRHVFAEASAATLRTAVDRVVGRLVSQLDRR